MITAQSSIPRTPETGRFFIVCAHLAWILPAGLTLAALILGAFQDAYDFRNSIIVGAITSAGFFAGVICGVAGLAGIPRHGKRGILAPALSGLLLCFALLLTSLLGALALPSYFKARELEMRTRIPHPPGGLREAVFNKGGPRAGDPELAFSFEFPPGFEPFPPEKPMAGYKFAYFKENKDEAPPAVILVKDLHAILLPRRFTADRLPTGKGMTLETFDWRGLPVDAARVPEEVDGTGYLTFNVRIPLKKGAIQIGFGDLASNEAALRQRVLHVLATLDGETNW